MPSSDLQSPIVTFDRVTFTHDERTTPALKDISLTIRRGSITLLVGPSGCGKSTLCMLMMGIVPHLLGGDLQGKVTLNGQDVAATPVKDLALSAGLLFQDPEWMIAALRVEDEVAFGPENLCLPRDEILRRVDSALDFVGLNDLRRNAVWALSGGQVQKLGFASVLAMETPLVILDEPTANLDPATTHVIHQLILKLREEGKAVVLVTKDLDEFIAQADQIVFLKDGGLVADGPPRQVVAAYGQQMLDAGVWLPEPAEIGLRLASMGRLESQQLPLTIAEAAEAYGRFSFREYRRARQTALQGERLIQAQGVEFAYSPAVKALNGISFEVFSGELLAIIGQNGAGKSTLAKLLVSLLKPTRGELTLFGKNARQWRAAELANHIALVFQNPEHQFLCDTVTEELAYSLLAKGIDQPQRVEQLVGEMLRQMELEESAAMHPFALSAGAKRRLGVATMLVGGGVELLIVDEPTYGQDRRMTEKLMEMIRRFQQEGIGVVMITHDMRLVEAHIDRAMVMAQGQKIFDGSPQQLFQQSEIVEQAWLRPTGLRRLLSALKEKGVNISEEISSVDQFIEAVQ
jgi:energy-coupling factor transport system ATP-binding protein